MLTQPLPCLLPPPQASILKAAGTSLEALRALDTTPLAPPAGLSVATKVTMATDTDDLESNCTSDNKNITNDIKLSLEEDSNKCVDKMTNSSDTGVRVSPPLATLLLADKEDGKTVKSGEESGPDSPSTPQDRTPLAADKGEDSPRSDSGDKGNEVSSTGTVLNAALAKHTLLATAYCLTTAGC